MTNLFGIQIIIMVFWAIREHLLNFKKINVFLITDFLKH